MTSMTHSTDRALATALDAWPIFGGSQGGIVSSADALVNQLADGTDLNELFLEFQTVMELQNKMRTSVASLLSYYTTDTAEVVPQNFSVGSLQETTEFGVPTALGTPADALVMGFQYKDFGARSAFTWKFLRNADRRHVEGIIDSVLAADNKLTTGTVLRRIFDPTETRNEFGHRVFSLWNGTDGIAPPPHLGRTFPETESHYIASGASALDSADIEDAMRLITRKGYGTKATGSQLIILANPDESEKIQTWRAGEESRPSSNILASYDFIPSVDHPPYLTDQTMVGQPVAADYQGLPVLGSFGPAILIETSFVPSGYVIVASTNGPNSTRNCLGFREHQNPAYRGLLLLPGQGPYPVVDSMHLRSFGVGVRHRSAAVCIQVTTNTSYTKPADSLIPV